MQRLRVTYAVDFPLHYASMLDRAQVWERAARRAALTLVYSGGFSPRPRLQVAAALPVGFRAQGELLDLWLAEPIDPTAAQAALAGVLPEGLAVRQVEEVSLDEPALPTQVQAAEYSVTVETEAAVEEVRRRVTELLAAEQLPRQRRGRPYDLRPLVERLWVEGDERRGDPLWSPNDPRRSPQITLGMILSAQEGATGRPEEVLDALGLAGGFYRVYRCRLVLTVQKLPQG